MKYAIIDQDGDCVDKGFENLDEAISEAKYFMLKGAYFSADKDQLFIHEMPSEDIISEGEVATVNLEITWKVEREI